MPTWTTDLPTVSGYYWFRLADPLAEKRRVWAGVRPDGTVRVDIWNPPDGHPDAVAGLKVYQFTGSAGHWWYGPLPKNEKSSAPVGLGAPSPGSDDE